GRFASRDSMLDQIPYVYCGGDPVDWADPTGHFRPTNAELGAIIVGVGGAIIGTVVGIIAAGPVGGIEGGIEGAKTGIAVGAWIGGTVGAGLGGYVGAREDGDNQADALTEGGIAMIGVGLTGMCPALAALWLAK
ncbi:MAG: hypothetical protein KGK12_14610, partial [Armatimonadetes bacterium]|nr:hypothetical protein [Armatimonadota bacterium]